MKISIFLIALITSFNAFTCQKEGQFIGKVVNLTSECTYQIQLYFYNENINCGLSSEEVSQATMIDKSCQVKNGETISGIIFKNKDNILELE